jgi:hypothetical protein
MTSIRMNSTFPLKREPGSSALLSACACYGTRQILSWKCQCQRHSPCNYRHLPRVAQVTTTMTVEMTMAVMTTAMLVAQATLLQEAHLSATAIHRDHQQVVRSRAQTNVLPHRGSLQMKRRPYPRTTPSRVGRPIK